MARLAFMMTAMGMSAILKKNKIPLPKSTTQSNPVVALLASNWTHLFIVAAVALHQWYCR